MGIFGKLFEKKESENSLFWKENPEELTKTTQLGNEKLDLLNKESKNIDYSFDVNEIVKSKDVCLDILDWFQLLEDKECPYHIINGAKAFRQKVIMGCNSSLVNANKLSIEDFSISKEHLSKEVPNYEICLSSIISQESNIPYLGTPQRWLKKIRKLFDDNVAMPFVDVYTECGFPREKEYFSELDNLIPLKKDSSEMDVFRTIQFAINERYGIQNRKISFMDETQYNLNLHNNEHLLYRINGVIFYEEKTTRLNVSYSGLRWSNGLLRAGTLQLATNEIKNFVAQDVGRLFITTKRVILIGSQRNITKAINIENIITYNLFQDGVLVLEPNKKAVLFKFEPFNDDEIMIQDGLNEFVSIVNRVINNNFEFDLIK